MIKSSKLKKKIKENILYLMIQSIVFLILIQILVLVVFLVFGKKKKNKKKKKNYQGQISWLQGIAFMEVVHKWSYVLDNKLIVILWIVNQENLF